MEEESRRGAVRGFGLRRKIGQRHVQDVLGRQVRVKAGYVVIFCREGVFVAMERRWCWMVCGVPCLEVCSAREME